MGIVYLAEGEAGQYDDWSHWVIGVFSTRAKAKKACLATVKDQELKWSYSAKSGESATVFRGSNRFDDGEFLIRKIEVDTRIW